MFNSLKRALGFGHQEYTDFESPFVQESEQEQASAAVASADATDLPVVNVECGGELLDAILSVINANLPPLVAESIDSERQRVKLTEMLGPALADFARKMRMEVESEMKSDRAKMQSELDDLRSQKKDFASKREVHKANMLSEQRQRRALTDRNRDLEAKIDELQSEIEQHKLSISSLLNKIRVSEVNDSEIESLKESYDLQIKELSAKLDAKEAENIELAAKIAELEVPQALEAALEQRKEIVEATEAPASKKPVKPRKPRHKKKITEVQAQADAQLDELDLVNFLVPGGVPAGHTPTEPNPDFGYQPPKPSPEPNPDIQLTLF